MQPFTLISYQHDIIQRLAESLPHGVECWLVGGALRDDLLGRQATDFDFALDSDPTPIAKRFAFDWGGTYIDLDPGRRQSRVVMSLSGSRYVLDFAPLRAATLYKDLELRDFTCNAMARSLRHPQTLIDPLGGQRDLLLGVLEPCSEHVLGHDPLRMIKGIRHCVELNLEPTQGYAEQCARFRGRLQDVASERVKAELGRVYAHSQVSLGVQLLRRYRLLDDWLSCGEIQPEAIPVNRVIAAEKHLEEIVGARLERRLDEWWPMYALVRFYASIRSGDDIGKLTNRFRFSRKAGLLFQQLETLDGLSLLPEVAKSSRARALWVDGLGYDPLAGLLYLTSLPRFARIDLRLHVSDWLAAQVNGRVPDLIGAKALVREWGVVPGVGLGRGLKMIRHDEICGRISSPFSLDEIVAEYFKKD